MPAAQILAIPRLSLRFARCLALISADFIMFGPLYPGTPYRVRDP